MTTTTPPSDSSAQTPPTTTSRTRFAHVDPTSVLIGANIRTDARLDPDFLASVRDLGVLVPVCLREDADGGLTLSHGGQRRTLAAIEVGCPLPAVIVTGEDNDAVQRVIEQMAENDDRAALGQIDHAAAFQTLALLGVPAAEIARRTRRSKATVQAGITTAASQNASTALHAHDLTLEDAAVFADFEDDAEATARLNEAAMHGHDLQHTAARIREDRARQIAVAAVRADLDANGIVLVHRPGYWDTKVRALVDLRAKGAKGPLSPDEHSTCPGHAAWIDYDEEGRATAVHVCTDYKTHGHLKWIDPATKTERTPMSDDDRAARREVVENNAAWRAAEGVRREWLATFVGRKTAPKDATAFIATALTFATGVLDKAGLGGHTLASTWLGHRDPLGGRQHLDRLVTRASVARAQMIALALTLAAIEENSTPTDWRHPGGMTGRYLLALEAWGYPLSDIERVATGRDGTDEGHDD
jgi:ParB family chromosome partitioning protein